MRGVKGDSLHGNPQLAAATRWLTRCQGSDEFGNAGIIAGDRNQSAAPLNSHAPVDVDARPQQDQKTHFLIRYRDADDIRVGARHRRGLRRHLAISG